MGMEGRARNLAMVRESTIGSKCIAGGRPCANTRLALSMGTTRRKTRDSRVHVEAPQTALAAKVALHSEAEHLAVEASGKPPACASAIFIKRSATGKAANSIR
jgi:hypothetical protein